MKSNQGVSKQSAHLHPSLLGKGSATHRGLHHVGLAVPQGLHRVENVHNVLAFHHFHHDANGTEHATPPTAVSESKESKGISAAQGGCTWHHHRCLGKNTLFFKLFFICAFILLFMCECICTGNTDTLKSRKVAYSSSHAEICHRHRLLRPGKLSFQHT